MNNSIISSVINSTESTIQRTNVFSLDIKAPTLYMPQYISINGYPDNTCGGDNHFQTLSFDIRDQYITALNYLMLSLELPEIKGEGKFAYTHYIGYKCIQHVGITCGDIILWESDGEELFDSCLSEEFITLSGYSPELNDLSVGLTPNDTIKEATVVYVYIKTPFDSDKTFSSLKLMDSKITVTITFCNISDVIIYDSRFLVEQFIRDFVYIADLHLIAYMVKDVKIKPFFIERNRKVVGCASIPTAVISDVHACTGISIYVKPYYGMMENKFMSYPGFRNTEADYIRALVNNLLSDIVIVSEEMPGNDCFPCTAEFIKVPNSGQISIQETDIIIKIDNVPIHKNIYYHLNLLVFSTRKNSFVYNISKKFTCITGTYCQITDNINFSHVEHSINITDASIPVSFWTSQKNVCSGDNRSFYSKMKDLYVNEPFRKGIDMINKTDIISRLEIRYGNDLIYSETLPITKIFNMLLNGKTKNVRKLIFNMNPINLFRPTTLNSNVSRGRDKLSVRVDYTTIDPNNPIYYISKQIIIICNDLYRIDYAGNISISKITEEVK